ncbi:MAG TPA: hypothetical protein VM099_08970 [Gemmatimonadaceae bacterium]|nr:hypothetical protein [Gemmatimonadaceae bacterium]
MKDKMTTDWPFEDTPNTACITTVHVIERRRPILLVTRDEEECDFQFLCGTTNNSDDARVVGLGSILKLDPTVAEVADLPPGWRAWRDDIGSPWSRAPVR